MNDCYKHEDNCGACKDEGFEIEIGRDEETKDFLVWCHDKGKATDKQIIEILKQVIAHLDFGEVRGEA